MARCINQVKGIGIAVRRRIRQSDCARLYGYASLPLEIHIVKDLVFHNTLLDCSTLLN